MLVDTAAATTSSGRGRRRSPGPRPTDAHHRATSRHRLSVFNSEVPQWINRSGTARYVATSPTTPTTSRARRRDAAVHVGRQFGKTTWSSEICCFSGIGTGWGRSTTPHHRWARAGEHRSSRTSPSPTTRRSTGGPRSQAWAASPPAGTAPPSQRFGWNDGLIYYDPNYANNGNQALYLTKRYYTLGHYSKFVRPGAVRYPVLGAPSGVQAMAFTTTAAGPSW